MSARHSVDMTASTLYRAASVYRQQTHQYTYIYIYTHRGVEVIQSQIQSRQQHHLLDMEKKDQETQVMLKYLERLQEEDMEKLQKKREAQHSLMEEVAKCNDVSADRLSYFCKLLCIISPTS